MTGVGIGLLGGAIGGLFSGSTNTKTSSGTSYSGGKNIDTLTINGMGMDSINSSASTINGRYQFSVPPSNLKYSNSIADINSRALGPIGF